MTKTLEELSRDYFNAANILTQRIHERNEKLKLLAPASNKAERLKREIRALYNERAETTQIAMKLATYYEN